MLIEDRNQAEKGNIYLKERWAVLCASRLLIFKNEKDCRGKMAKQALSVYPLGESQFEIRGGELLKDKNF